LIEEIFKRQGNLSEEQLIKIGSLYLSDHEITQVKTLGEVDTNLGMDYCQELIRERTLDKIQNILMSENDTGASLEAIRSIATTSIIQTQQSRAKRMEDFDKTEEEYIFKFLRAPFSKRKLYMFFAYSGVGKTTMSLICAKVAESYGQKVLYIPIKDWSESSLYHQLKKIDNPPNIEYAVYPECTMAQIESEIVKVQPDVVIVDSMKGITNYFRHEQDFIEYGNRVDQLRMLSNEYDTCMITTHQLVVKEELVLEQHLQGGKSHILEHVDIGFGIGHKEGSKKERVINWVKTRGIPAEEPYVVSLDFKKFTVSDVGTYTPPQPEYGGRRNNYQDGRLRG